MKRIVALALTLIVALSSFCVCSFNAAAKTIFSEELQQQIDQLDDSERLTVTVWMAHKKIDTTKAWITTCEEFGLDPNNYNQKYPAGFFDTHDKNVIIEANSVCTNVINDLDIAEDVIYSTARYAVADLTKEKIEQAGRHSDVIMISRYAEGVFPVDNSGYFCKDDFDKLPNFYDKLLSYDELYFHKDAGGEIDWVLVEAHGMYVTPAYGSIEVGHRVFKFSDLEMFFPSGYAVYTVADRQFHDLMLADSENMEEYSPDLGAVYDEIGMGRFRGDIDNDGQITVVDCAYIQRCLAKMRDFPKDDTDYIIKRDDRVKIYYSDFDRDGERTITDVSCIQRYLAKMHY